MTGDEEAKQMAREELYASGALPRPQGPSANQIMQSAPILNPTGNAVPDVAHDTTAYMGPTNPQPVAYGQNTIGPPERSGVDVPPDANTPGYTPPPPPGQEAPPQQQTLTMPQYAPLQHIKAAWQDVGRQTSGLTGPMADIAREATNSAYNTGTEAIAAQGDADKIKNQGQLDYANALIGEAENNRHAVNSLTNRRDEAVSQQLQSLQDTRQQISSLKVDPDHYFNEKGTLAKIIAAIAIGAGGFVQGSTGRENGALGIINNAINRDIEAQNKNIALKRESAADQAAQLNETRQEFKDKTADAIMKRDAQLTYAKAYLDQAVAKAADPQTQSNLLGLRSKLDEEHAKNAAALADHTAKSEKFIPAHTIGGPPSGQVLTKEEAARTYTLPNGETRVARDAKEAGEKQTISDATIRMAQATAANAKDKEELDNTVLPWKRAAIVARIEGRAETIAQAKNTIDTGKSENLPRGAGGEILLGSAQNIVPSVIPGGNILTSGRQRDANAEAAAYAANAQANLSNYGERVSRNYAVDSHGNKVPTYSYQGRQESAGGLAGEAGLPASATPLGEEGGHYRVRAAKSDKQVLQELAGQHLTRLRADEEKKKHKK